MFTVVTERESEKLVLEKHIWSVSVSFKVLNLEYLLRFPASVATGFCARLYSYSSSLWVWMRVYSTSPGGNRYPPECSSHALELCERSSGPHTAQTWPVWSEWQSCVVTFGVFFTLAPNWIFHSFFFLKLYLFYFIFSDKVSLCSLGYPGTHYVGRASLELTEAHLPPPHEW